MKKIILMSLMSLSFVMELMGQGYRWKVLRNSSDSILRCVIVDSLVNESFWSIDASSMRLYRNYYCKSDFSEQSKEKLLSYFNRNLNDVEIQKVKDETKQKFDMHNIEQIRNEAEKNKISFDSLYSAKLNEIVSTNLKNLSNYARSSVSPIYAYLLGWLDYKPAILILESILSDSLKMKNYSNDNKEELELSCKLALARMGNKQYQEELLKKYKKVEMSCNNPRYTDFLQNLFYINNRECIDYVIQLSEDDKMQTQSYMYGLVTECSPQGVILIYLANVINDYPLKFEYEETKYITMEYPQGIEFESFYKNQFAALSNWLQKNTEKYEINTEKLYLP